MKFICKLQRHFWEIKKTNIKLSVSCNKNFPKWFYTRFSESKKNWASSVSDVQHQSFPRSSTLGGLIDARRTFVLSNIKCQLWTVPPRCFGARLFLRFSRISSDEERKIHFEPFFAHEACSCFISAFEISPWRRGIFCHFSTSWAFFRFLPIAHTLHTQPTREPFDARSMLPASVLIIWFHSSLGVLCKVNTNSCSPSAT